MCVCVCVCVCMCVYECLCVLTNCIQFKQILEIVKKKNFILLAFYLKLGLNNEN